MTIDLLPNSNNENKIYLESKGWEIAGIHKQMFTI